MFTFTSAGDTVASTETSFNRYMGVTSVHLDRVSLSWPVDVRGVSEGWAYGIYSRLKLLSHRELLESGRLHWGNRKNEEISESQVDSSFRHHEALAVAMERRVLFETDTLDLQKFSQPGALVSEEQIQVALMALLNLVEGDDAAALSYFSDFGEFDHLEVQDDKFEGPNIPDSIQAFCKDSQQDGHDPFAVSLNQFWAVRRDIEELWNLAAAVDQKDVQRIHGECIRRRPNSHFDLQTDWLALGKAILCADLSASLNPGQGNPRLFLSEREGKLIAVTMGTTLRSALYLALLDITVSKTEFRKCLKCTKYFIVTVKRKQYCTDDCQKAAKVRRFRDKQKSAMASNSQS